VSIQAQAASFCASAEVYGAGGLWLDAAISQAFTKLPLQSFSTLFIPSPVTNFSSDSTLQKTNDELRFYVEHPEQYHPSLVDMARQELRRRGALPAQAPPALDPVYTHTPTRTGSGSKVGVVLALLAAVGLCGGGFYLSNKRDAEAAAAAQAAAKAKALQAPPKLTEVATSALPTYDGVVAKCVEDQMKRLPAAERAAATAAGKPLHQYRELAKRFWTAQTLSEYLVDQARQGKRHEVLPRQVDVVLAAWQRWNSAMVYSYKLGPTMSNHVDLMSRVARQQQDALADLQNAVETKQPLQDNKTALHDADMNDMLSGLLPASPVTGKPYVAHVRHINL